MSYSEIGFDDKNKKEYIHRYFSNYDSEHHDHVYSEINKSETLRSLGEIPLFLWLMCSSLTQPGSQLPDRISELLRLATSLMYEQKISKDCTSKPQQKITEEGFNLLMTKLGRVALGGLMFTSRGKYSFAVSEFDSEDDVNLGCDVGLLARVQTMHGMKKVERVKFYHTILMQFCCSVYLSGITESGNTGKFNEHMSTLLEGDVERFGYLFRFCSGLNMKAAQCVVEMTKKHLSVYNKNTPVDCERYICLHKIMMLALFEAKLGVTVKTLELDEWVRFPYELKGEDLLAAHYFVQNLQQRSSLQHVSHLTIICQGQTDLDLLTQTMAGIVMCDLTLEVVGINMSDKIHKLKNISKCVISLTLNKCQLSCASVPGLFKLLKSATKLKILKLSENNLHGLKSVQMPNNLSLGYLILNDSKLTKDDIGPLFSIVAAAGSVTKLRIHENDLHGIKAEEITPVSSLDELHLIACGIQIDDIGPLFSIVAAAGSVTKLVLCGNDLNGIKADEVTLVSSLKELHLYACGIQSGDIGPIFSILAATGSVTKLVLIENNLHGIKGDAITRISLLKELHLYESGIQIDDIGPLFSIVAAAGDITRLILYRNDLHGIKPDEITRVSSLKELQLSSCGIQSDDIAPLFSIVAAAGSVSTLTLVENDLHGIKGDEITTFSSLDALHLIACGIQSDDIGPLFSIVASAGSVTKLVLEQNNFHGIKADKITPVSSLKELQISSCGIKGDDIRPLFSIVATAGNVARLALHTNDLHGLKVDKITPVSSLIELHLEACGIQSDDIGPLFSIVAAAGSVSTLVLDKNNLHGIKGDEITLVSSLIELHLYECGIQSDDIGPLFSIMAAAGRVTKLFLRKNNLHRCIKGDRITRISSLKKIYLTSCGINKNDIEPIFSIVAAADSVRTLVLRKNDLHGIQGDQITQVPSLEDCI
ncbi:NACHT, LRR and PYD domains-containing protein 3-like [Asterias amurensis]|uniref:NACHT, LRR and PYD domains-containing protein 3-like n=1 Tax=Asterias amurensis TaxID=7602 RepID=UPI003AB50D3F